MADLPHTPGAPPSSGPRTMRRLGALVRDERRLREALAEQERHRFDVDTALLVRDRAEEVIGTLGGIAHDDDLWERLREARYPLDEAQIARLRDVDGMALVTLLEAGGYRSPPPPAVLELVDDMLADLAVALEGPAGVPPAHRVEASRSHMLAALHRIRRQIREPGAGALEESLLRTSARTAGHAARWMLPRVAAVSAGAVAESVLPGTGVGVAVTKAAAKIGEDATELVATSMTERVFAPGGPVEVSRWDEDELARPVHAHLAALADQVHALRIEAELVEGTPGAGPVLARRALRSVRRLDELARDHGVHDPHLREVIEEMTGAVEHLLDVEHPHRAQEALHRLGENIEHGWYLLHEHGDVPVFGRP